MTSEKSGQISDNLFTEKKLDILIRKNHDVYMNNKRLIVLHKDGVDFYQYHSDFIPHNNDMIHIKADKYLVLSREYNADQDTAIRILVTLLNKN